MLNLLNKYLDDLNLNELLESTDEELIINADYETVKTNLEIFENYNFYFISDIIVNYFDILLLEPNVINEKILFLKETFGDDYLINIGDNLSLLNTFYT